MAEPDNHNGTTAVLLLAAGGSLRLGRPKQLLDIEGESLLRHSLRVTLEAGLGPVIVVLGAHAKEVQTSLEEEPVQVVYNADWQEGMAASIRCGIAHLQEINPSVQSVILMVCDQPHLSSDILQNLVAAHLKTGKPIVTCSYADTFGPPTLFHQSMFAEMLQLKGDVGARSILKAHANNVEAIPFPEGVVDIDTETDYRNIANHKPTS
jgi:molybdenum cofactor cytidylyltransferase